MELYIKRFGTIILFIILLSYFLKIYGFFNNRKAEIIRSDGIGYYSYLPAIFIYNDYKQEDIKSIGALNCIISFYNDKDKNYFYKVRPVDKYFENNDGWRRFEIAVNAVAIHSLNDKCILFFECGLNDSFCIVDTSVQVISQL